MCRGIRSPAKFLSTGSLGWHYYLVSVFIMDIKKFLNAIEQEEIRKVVDNKTVLGAVKKVLLYSLYTEGTLTPGEDIDVSSNSVLDTAMVAIQQSPGITDEMLGQGLRATTQAIRLLDLAFKELEKLQTVSLKGKGVNQAR